MLRRGRFQYNNVLCSKAASPVRRPFAFSLRGTELPASTQYRAIGRYVRFYVVYVKSAERTRSRLALARQCNGPFLELSLQGYLRRPRAEI